MYTYYYSLIINIIKTNVKTFVRDQLLQVILASLIVLVPWSFWPGWRQFCKGDHYMYLDKITIRARSQLALNIPSLDAITYFGFL